MNNVKRPFAIIGFSFLATSCLILTVPKEYSLVLLALSILLTAVHYFTRNIYTKQLLIVLTTAIVSMLYTNVYCQLYEAAIDDISRDTKIYTGYITQKNSQNNPSPYTLQLVNTNDGNKEEYSVKFFSVDEFEIGDCINIEGKFAPFKASQYNFGAYFRGIKGNIDPLKITKSNIEPEGYKYVFLMQKQKLLWKAQLIYSSETIPLVWSMGYSDKSLNTQGHSELFQTAGISHALVVSGFHVVILLSFINAIIIYIPISKKIKNIIVAVLLLIFMNVIGLSPSIVRAGTLTVLALVAVNFRKDIDGLTTLGLIAFVTTVFCPYAARDVGLLLSYGACLGLMAAGHISKKKHLSKSKSSLLAAVMAVLVTMPILSFVGMPITLLSPIFNLLLLPFISIICGLSFFTPIISYLGVVGSVANFVLVPINTFAINFLLVALEMINKYFSFALVNLGAEIILVLCISATVGLVVGFIQFKNTKFVQLFAIGISLFSVLCYNFLNSNVVTITAFDSGRKPSFIISYKQETDLILSEFTTAKKLKEKLTKNNNSRYNKIFLCTKDEIKTDALAEISDSIIDMSKQNYSKNEYMLITSDIDKKHNKYTLQLGKQSIVFGHGKVDATASEGADFYFLGNDKPKSVYADNIFIFGNTPKWMEIKNIQELSTDCNIKINLKTGRYRIVKDVYNFGY